MMEPIIRSFSFWLDDGQEGKKTNNLAEKEWAPSSERKLCQVFDWLPVHSSLPPLSRQRRIWMAVEERWHLFPFVCVFMCTRVRVGRRKRTTLGV